MKAARPQGQVTHKFKYIYFHFHYGFQGSTYRKHYLSVYYTSPHYSEYLNYYLILLLGIILFLLLFFIFYFVYESFSLCAPLWQLVHCPHSWLSIADLIGLVPRSWLFASYLFLSLSFFREMINISLLASCKKEGKINAIYYILPQQVQVCAHASLCVLKMFTMRGQRIV